ncbi:MAG: hypothetical protein ABR551_13005 [Gemmatimonadales bacterium]
MDHCGAPGDFISPTSSEYQQRLAAHDAFLRRILDGPTLKVIG